jgi:putative PIN family toxin of toxin-antitoxin system
VARAVLDPNVLVSVLISRRGAGAEILLELRAGAFELVISPKLLRELEDVLKREKFRRYVEESDVDAYLELLRHEGIVVEDPEQPPQPICQDPDDEYLVTLARAARVEALVSGDPHLLRLRGRIPVLSPREFAELLSSRG